MPRPGLRGLGLHPKPVNPKPRSLVCPAASWQPRTAASAPPPGNSYRDLDPKLANPACSLAATWPPCVDAARARLGRCLNPLHVQPRHITPRPVNPRLGILETPRL
eukprot:78636-Chlamydomonas_euryale.AAC.1